MNKKYNNKGDTIVEVLIAIAVLSAVLGGAIVSANRNLATTRATQERGEALKLVEEQLELMKTIAISSPNSIKGVAGNPNPFCIDSNLNVIAPPCITAPGAANYRLETNYDAGSGTHTVRAEWDRIGGGDQSIDIKYKVVVP